MKATKTMIKAFALGAFVLALPFVAGLLGASAARAADVIFDSAEERKAIGVTNLEFKGTFYDVTFPEQMTAQEVYGDPPGLYPFGNLEDTQDAVRAIDDVLNDFPEEADIPLYVGVEGGETDESTQFFLVGWRRTGDVGFLDSITGENILAPSPNRWEDNESFDNPIYSSDERTFAVFTPVPEPSPGLSVLAALGTLTFLLRRRSGARVDE